MLDRNGTQQAVWLDTKDCDVEAFKRHIAQETRAEDYRHTGEIAKGIPIYDGDAMRRSMADEKVARSVMAEWNRSFQCGPGIIAIRAGYDDLGLVDAVTVVLNSIIADEEAGSAGKGDHFAAAAANSRMRNAHEKLCMRAPDLFVRYNANELTRRAAESWLGSGYQTTT